VSRSNASASPRKQLRLRLPLRHLPREAFAGVAQRAVHQLRLLAPLRHEDLDLAPQLLGQRVGHQVGILDRVRQDQLPRRVLLVVELADERLQHLGRIDIGTDAGVVILVAPVLVGADEEDLNAGLPALHVERDDIGLPHAARVDALADCTLVSARMRSRSAAARSNSIASAASAICAASCA
jgi:hypothetical protein